MQTSRGSTIVGTYCILVLIGLGMGQCKKRQDSDLKTTSDRIKEFGYVLSGSISLPIAIEPYLLSHALDLKREIDDEYTLTRTAAAKIALSDISQLRDNFSKTYKNAYPLVDKQGTVIQEHLKYWIDRQIKYSRAFLLERSLSLRLSEVITIENIAIKAGVVSFDYQAFCLGVRDFSKRLVKNEVFVGSLQVGDRIPVPENEIEAYF